MTREPLDLLRAADPVPQPVSYSEDELARRVADILTHPDRPATLVVQRATRTRPRWLAAGLAAAAVLVLAVLSAAVLTRGGNSDEAAGPAPVSCAVSTSGGTAAVSARLKQAEAAIGQRVHESGGSVRAYVTDPDDGTIGFTPHGIPVTEAARACRVSTVAIRPVVAPWVRVDARSPRSPDPLAALPFAVPSDDVAYERLSAAQRAVLTSAMSHFDCTASTTAATAGLACATVPGATQVLLLGPALVTGPDVRSATAVAPNTGAEGGNVDWTVALEFRAAGAARFEAFTGRYHTGSEDASVSTCGPSGTVPCADFLAITVNGRVLSVPVTNAVLESAVSISGGFDKAAAQTLAGEVTAAVVQLRPR